MQRSQVLVRRADFLAAAKTGQKIVTTSCVIQWRGHEEKDSPSPFLSPDMPRFGLTASRRLGNAVTRNRIKRRLREALRVHLNHYGLPATDYVFIGRRQTFDAPFEVILRDIRYALRRIQRESEPATSE